MFINDLDPILHSSIVDCIWRERMRFTWKQAAKKWRLKAIGASKASRIDDVVKMVDLQDKADRRLKLLRKVEWVWMPGHPWQCLICQQERDTGHSGDCELAKEIKDETV